MNSVDLDIQVESDSGDMAVRGQTDDEGRRQFYQSLADHSVCLYTPTPCAMEKYSAFRVSLFGYPVGEAYLQA